MLACAQINPHFTDKLAMQTGPGSPWSPFYTFVIQPWKLGDALYWQRYKEERAVAVHCIKMHRSGCIALPGCSPRPSEDCLVTKSLLNVILSWCLSFRSLTYTRGPLEIIDQREKSSDNIILFTKIKYLFWVRLFLQKNWLRGWGSFFFLWSEISELTQRNII